MGQQSGELTGIAGTPAGELSRRAPIGPRLKHAGRMPALPRGIRRRCSGNLSGSAHRPPPGRQGITREQAQVRFAIARSDPVKLRMWGFGRT